jgi:hypothetical protein
VVSIKPAIDDGVLLGRVIVKDPAVVVEIRYLARRHSMTPNFGIVHPVTRNKSPGITA